jgi:hypothetical protein
MNNPKHSMADALKADVTYLGQNGVKQHLFGNGTALVTHVFTTLPEAIERFGSRIKIDDRPYKMSLNFKQGYGSATYSPRPNADRVERLEYAFGHLKRLLEQADAKKAAQPVKPVDMRLPHEVLADKTKAEKAASRIVSKEIAKTPYTLEQMRDMPYTGTRLERADRAAGGPELRAEIRKQFEGTAQTGETVVAAPTKAAMSQGIAAIAKRRGRPPASKPAEMEIGDEGV